MTDAEMLALCEAAISQIASNEEIGPRAWLQHGFDQIEKFAEACDPDTIRALILRAQAAEVRVTELEQQRDRTVASLRELAAAPKKGLGHDFVDLALRREADDIEAGRI